MGELADITQEYIINSLIDVEKTYEVNRDNEFLEDDGGYTPMVILENGLYIVVDRVRVEYGDADREVHVDFNDYAILSLL